jgi:hypothetical protein
MKPDDRDSRLYTASMLITLLKLHGGSARFAATYLGVSPSMMSNWLHVKETESRGLGAPSDEHLRKLATLLVWQIRQGMGAMLQLMGSQEFRMREQIMLTRALAGDYGSTADHMRGQSEHWSEFIADMRTMAEKYGPRVLDVVLAPSEAHWELEKAGEASLEASEIMPAEQFFGILEIADEEIKAHEEHLTKFFEKHNREILEKLRQRRLRKAVQRLSEAPD